MELAVKTLAGKTAGKITVDDAIFGIDEIRDDILQRTVRWQLARRQAGTHKAKSRISSMQKIASSTVILPAALPARVLTASSIIRRSLAWRCLPEP